MDDVEIIEAILKGDHTGYTVLFKRHRSKVFNYLSRRITNIMDVEDLTMVTFEKAFEKLHTWKPKFKFSTWLIQIAKYTMIDWIKAQQIRFTEGEELENYRHLHDSSYTPYQILIQKELKSLIEGRIDRLPKKSRPVMKLHFDGYSDEEIVEKLNMMHGNIRCILSRAKDKLKSLRVLLHEENNIIRASAVA